MPVEVLFTPQDDRGETKTDLRDIVLPEYASAYENFAHGGREIIAVRCPPDDDVAEVYIIPDVDDIILKTIKDLKADSLPEDFDFNKIIIGHYESYEQNFRNENGANFTVSVRHLGYAALFPMKPVKVDLDEISPN